MSDRVGEHFGNYRLVRLLGAGGFAEVYLGEHVYLNTQAAIKVLQTRLEAEEQEHFLNEARIIARLVYPHIVRVLDFGVEREIPYLVMDYAPNGTLRQRFPRGVHISPATILPYIKQVASALDYAHAQHLIHRDIKPENMLLNGNDEVVLSDFGIALIIQSTRFGSTQDVYGTATYMAPEQIQGKAEPATDQYALGTVIYEWLSGEPPFQGSFSELCSQHLFASPPPLYEKVPGISPAIEAVVEKTLAKDPQERYPTVEAMASAFEDACSLLESADSIQSPEAGVAASDSEPELTMRRPGASALKPSTGVPLAPTSNTAGASSSATHSGENVAYPATQHAPVPPSELPALPELPSAKDAEQPRISRRKLLVGLGAAGIAAAAGGSIWYLVAREQGASTSSTTRFTAPPSPTPSTTAIVEGSTIFTYRGHSDTVYAVSWSPNGQYIASGSGDTTVQVWGIAEENPLLYTYHGHAGLFNTVYAVGWASNGRSIASGGADKTVQVWDAATGNRLLTYRGHMARVLALAWAPDNQFIASAGADNTVQVWDATTGVPLYIYHGHIDTIYTLAWSPDGRYLASGSADKTVQVWNAATGIPLTMYHGNAATVYALSWSPDGMNIASAGADRTVQVWDAATGKDIYAYHGHTGLSNVISALSWSPNGKRIASGSTDKTVQVWDATTGGHAYIYHGHTDTIYVVGWSPDGQHIASGGADKTVKVWVG